MNPPRRQGKKFYLKWPWNVVVYVALALLLRIFSIPIILLLMAWNKKQQPDGPEEGYCLQRTRRQLARLVWAVFFLVIGAACGALFISQMMGDKVDWDATDYVTLAVAGVIGLAGIVGGLYEAYADVRDAFFPEKSRLAKSIRAQLPYPDEAPGVKELFSMVDQDIKENGQWFDRVAVGKEWVLGDEVTAISRIRVVAGRDEVKYRTVNGRTQSSRIVELHILDDRRHVQITGLRDPKELGPLLSCLKLRAPEALFRHYDSISDFCTMPEEKWQSLERDYQRRLAARKMDAAEREYATYQSNPYFVLIDLHGQRTSRFDQKTLEAQLPNLQEGGEFLGLEILEPIAVPDLNGARLAGLYASVANGSMLLTAKMQMAGGGIQFFAREAGEMEVRQSFADLLGGRRPPAFAALSQWKPLGTAAQARQSQQKKLVYSDSRGVPREFASFSRRDVELAGEGLASGKYTTVALYVGARYLYLQAGDKSDGRVTANASQPGRNELKVFETKCTDRQAMAWLLALDAGTFVPDFSQWKDITRQLKKQTNRKNK